ITWDNVLQVSPKTATDLGYRAEERDAMVNEKQTILVDLKYRGKTIRVPLWVVPGHADGCATLCFGYWRDPGGHIAWVGVNVYPVRFSDAMSGGGGAEISRPDVPAYTIACTQEHQNINPDVVGDRGIIRSATFSEYQGNPYFVRSPEANPEEE